VGELEPDRHDDAVVIPATQEISGEMITKTEPSGDDLFDPGRMVAVVEVDTSVDPPVQVTREPHQLSLTRADVERINRRLTEMGRPPLIRKWAEVDLQRPVRRPRRRLFGLLTFLHLDT